MSKQDAIHNAAKAVKAHGYSLPASLEKQIEGLENPQYRVAVVGEYQVGKSTLINRVFLGDKPLLTEGHGLCTTAVATDLEYGPTPQLEVFEWADSSQTSEKSVKVLANPSENDVDDATVSSAMDTRADLAKKISRVRVQVPNDSLRGYTVIDTPGLDDPNQELLENTTWRIIPGSDVALLVVRGDRQLGDHELKLLQKEIMGKNGIARLMVLASFNPNAMPQNAEKRKSIIGTIKDQLAKMGLDHLPVEMYCFDSSIGDIMSDVSEIRMVIRSFLNENALPGREEKIANLLRSEIEKDLAEIAAKIKASGISEAEREALKARVEREVETFKRHAEGAFEGFQNGLVTERNRMGREVDTAIRNVFDKFIADLSLQDTLPKRQAFVKSAELRIRSDLQEKMSVIALGLRSDLERLLARYAADLKEGGKDWELFLSEEFNIKQGVSTKIPSIAIDLVNVLLMNLILPGGWLVAILAALIGKKIVNPLDKLLQVWVVSQAKTAVEEARMEVYEQVMLGIEQVLDTTLQDVKTAMEASNKAQVEAIRAALAEQPAAAAERAALESAKADFENVLATL